MGDGVSYWMLEQIPAAPFPVLVIQPISFCQTDARGPAYAAHDRGVTPRPKGHENRRLFGVRRREAGVLNLGGVGRATPVVIGGQSAAVPIMKLHRRVLQ